MIQLPKIEFEKSKRDINVKLTEDAWRMFVAIRGDDSPLSLKSHQIVVLPAFAALRASRRYFSHVPVDAMAMRVGSMLVGVSGLCYFALAVVG